MSPTSVCDLVEASTSDAVEFPTTLKRLHERTGTVEVVLARIVRSEAMPVIREAFDRVYPDAGLSDTKVVDIVLGQNREPG